MELNDKSNKGTLLVCDNFDNSPMLKLSLEPEPLEPEPECEAPPKLCSSSTLPPTVFLMPL
jgi:hypothetical protein